MLFSSKIRPPSYLTLIGPTADFGGPTLQFLPLPKVGLGDPVHEGVPVLGEVEQVVRF